MKVKIINSDHIVKSLHNKTALVFEVKEIHPPSGKSYIMYKAKLDEPTDVGGGIVLEVVNMPSTCFESFYG